MEGRTAHQPALTQGRLGTDDLPDEPTVTDGIGSISVFVSDIAKARSFWSDVLGLAVRAEPHDGLVVLDPGCKTSITLYQVPPDQPSMPIGRMTGMAFSTGDVGNVLSAVKTGGGSVVDWVGKKRIVAATMEDPDGNAFTVLDAARIVEPEPSDDATSTEAPN